MRVVQYHRAACHDRGIPRGPMGLCLDDAASYVRTYRQRLTDARRSCWARTHIGVPFPAMLLCPTRPRFHVRTLPKGLYAHGARLIHTRQEVKWTNIPCTTSLVSVLSFPSSGAGRYKRWISITPVTDSGQQYVLEAFSRALSRFFSLTCFPLYGCDPAQR